MGRHRMDTESVNRLALSQEATQPVPVQMIVSFREPLVVRSPTLSDQIFSMDSKRKSFIRQRGDDLIWLMIVFFIVVGLGAAWAFNP